MPELRPLGPLTVAEVMTEVDRRLRSPSVQTAAALRSKVFSTKAVAFNIDTLGYHLVLTPTGGSAGVGLPGSADLTVTTDKATLLGIVTGSQHPGVAFALGKVRVQGDLGLLGIIQEVLR